MEATIKTKKGKTLTFNEIKSNIVPTLWKHNVNGDVIETDISTMNISYLEKINFVLNNRLETWQKEIAEIQFKIEKNKNLKVKVETEILFKTNK